MAEKNKKRPIFSSRVERAAAKVIGSREQARDEARTRSIVQGIRTRAKAQKAFRKVLPSSTPRLRRKVIETVQNRQSRSAGRGEAEIFMRKLRKRKVSDRVGGSPRKVTAKRK